MIRRFTLILGFWFGANAFVAYAEEPQPNEGHIGGAVSREKGSNLVSFDYVAPESPTFLAGIKQGDILIAINGVPTAEMSVENVRASMRGDIGSVIKLSIRRNDSTQEISLTRKSLLETYSAAATAGDARAEFYLGHYFELGPSSTRNLTQAAEWYRKAADRNYAPAQVELAYMLRYGYGIPKDVDSAVALYRKAASQGDVVAERELAYCYLNGEGINQSDRDAFAWFYAAAQSDDPAAEENLAFLYGKGRGVARSDRAAFDWHYRAAQLNDPYGAWGLAYMYQEGLAVPRNLEEALKWYQKAQVGLPYNRQLDGEIAGLKTSLEHPDTGLKYLLPLMLCGLLLISFCSINLRLKTENTGNRLAIRLASILMFLGVCALMVPHLFVVPYRMHWLISMTANLVVGGGIGILACIKICQKPGEESPFCLKPSKLSLRGRS